jgi:hypothetical protein
VKVHHLLWFGDKALWNVANGLVTYSTNDTAWFKIF